MSKFNIAGAFFPAFAALQYLCLARLQRLSLMTDLSV